jgi:hypothetical protein
MPDQSTSCPYCGRSRGHKGIRRVKGSWVCDQDPRYTAQARKLSIRKYLRRHKK